MATKLGLIKSLKLHVKDDGAVQGYADRIELSEFKSDSVSSVYNTIVWYGKEKELTPELAKQIEENFPGSLEAANGGSLRDAYDGKMDLKMQKLAKSLVAQFPYSDKKSDDGMVPEDINTDELLPGFTDGDLLSYVSLNQGFILNNLKGWGLTVEDLGSESDAYVLSDILGCDVSTLDGVDIQSTSRLIQDFLLDNPVVLEDTTTTGDIGAHVPSAFGKKVARATYPGDVKDADGGFTGDLNSGFSLNELEDYVLKNEAAIKDALAVYGWGLGDIKSIDNYIDLASVLGCDSMVVKDIDFEATTSFIYDLLTGELKDAKTEESIVDLLWVLRSAGVTYESRKSLGIDKDEYREYIQGLIDDNGLSDLAALDTVSDSVNIFIANPSTISSLEDFTGVSVPEYSDKDITVANFEDGCSTVSTVGKSYDSVVRSVLALSLKDSTNPKSSWKSLVQEDVESIKDAGWGGDDAVSNYTSSVLEGFSTPMFFNNFSEAILDDKVVEGSQSVQDFLQYNDDSIKAYLSTRDGYKGTEDLYSLFLRAYVLYFEDLFFS